MVWIAPEVLFPVVEGTNQKVMNGSRGKQNQREEQQKRSRGSLVVQEEELGQLADQKSTQVKIEPPKALERRLEKRGDSPGRLYSQENKRKAVAKQCRPRKMTGKDTWFTGGRDT